MKSDEPTKRSCSQRLLRSLHGDGGSLAPTKSSSAGSMKKAIGTLDRCLSELDIKSRRLTVLSWMPPGGKMQEMRPSFTGRSDFLNLRWAAACTLANRPTNCAS